MTSLALRGGTPARVGPLEKFNTIGNIEKAVVGNVFDTGVLSGFLGGQLHGGPYVQRLEELWAAKFDVKHAIACNSATSGLLAAAFAVQLGPRDEFITTPYTMSATVAAPSFTGATPRFADIEEETFTLNSGFIPGARAMVITNLFGHPGYLDAFRKWCDSTNIYLIEDNAQSPLAIEGNRYAGTVGHIGVFSLNVHKHIQCGEGGIIATNDDALADRLRLFINHGEMSDRPAFSGVGLNLRMTEVTAAIGIAQLSRADEIIAGRIQQAEALTRIVKQFPWITPPTVRFRCTHVYYLWAFKFNPKTLGIPRELFISAMEAEGFPLVNGYVAPLYRLPAFQKFAEPCPVAERMHDTELGYFENCGWTLSEDQIQQFGWALKKIETHIKTLRGLI